MSKKISAILTAMALGMGAIGSAHAIDVKTQFQAIQTASPVQAQALFDGLSSTFAPMIVYRAVKSPTPTGGLIGVDANLDISMVDAGGINDQLSAIALAGGGSAESFDATLPLPKGHVHIALPFGLSAGMFALPEISGVSASGLEVQYAFIDGELGFIANATYTLAAVYNTTTLTVNNVMEVSTTGLGAKAAVGFDMPLLSISAYMGFENVDLEGKSLMGLTTALNKYSASETKTTTGVDVKLGIFGIGLELDTIGSVTTQNYKFGVGFGF
jgi:hypothetical protein